MRTNVLIQNLMTGNTGKQKSNPIHSADLKHGADLNHGAAVSATPSAASSVQFDNVNDNAGTGTSEGPGKTPKKKPFPVSPCSTLDFLHPVAKKVSETPDSFHLDSPKSVNKKPSPELTAECLPVVADVLYGPNRKDFETTTSLINTLKKNPDLQPLDDGQLSSLVHMSKGRIRLVKDSDTEDSPGNSDQNPSSWHRSKLVELTGATDLFEWVFGMRANSKEISRFLQQENSDRIKSNKGSHPYGKNKTKIYHYLERLLAYWFSQIRTQNSRPKRVVTSIKTLAKLEVSDRRFEKLLFGGADEGEQKEKNESTEVTQAERKGESTGKSKTRDSDDTSESNTAIKEEINNTKQRLDIARMIVRRSLDLNTYDNMQLWDPSEDEEVIEMMRKIDEWDDADEWEQIKTRGKQSSTTPNNIKSISATEGPGTSDSHIERPKTSDNPSTTGPGTSNGHAVVTAQSHLSRPEADHAGRPDHADSSIPSAPQQFRDFYFELLLLQLKPKIAGKLVEKIQKLNKDEENLENLENFVCAFENAKTDNLWAVSYDRFVYESSCQGSSQCLDNNTDNNNNKLINNQSETRNNKETTNPSGNLNFLASIPENLKAHLEEDGFDMEQLEGIQLRPDSANSMRSRNTPLTTRDTKNRNAKNANPEKEEALQSHLHRILEKVKLVNIGNENAGDGENTGDHGNWTTSWVAAWVNESHDDDSSLLMRRIMPNLFTIMKTFMLFLDSVTPWFVRQS